MERSFDLHLYLANWGSRRLMIRLPKRLIDRRLLDRLVSQADCVDVRIAGANPILDIARDEVTCSCAARDRATRAAISSASDDC